MAAVFFQKIRPDSRQFWKLLLTALCISLPGTIVSSAITAAVFGGITSSGSSLLVQLLHAGGLGMTASVCVVQTITDYLDRIVILFCTVVLYGHAACFSETKGTERKFPWKDIMKLQTKINGKSYCFRDVPVPGGNAFSVTI